jgi:histidyl-tRNA synthetase
MHDILPSQVHTWQWVEEHIRLLTANYGYEEIRTPIVEATELFARAVGDDTDIVSKEMYTFDDRNGDSLTLRPEATASCVRAAIQHGLLHNQTQRLWYTGPMFRHERPQKGRTRQFYQLGVEAFGFPGPDIDVEILCMTRLFLQRLGVLEKVRLEINTLGMPAERAQYREALITYFKQHENKLDEDSKKRLTSNPLRILDSKNPELKDVIANAPSILDYLSEASKQYFDELCEMLDALNFKYTINPRLVRGLDYYTHLVFEWITDELGAQGTVCAGGRYDNLVELIGGKSTPGVGFSLGLERLIEIVQQDEDIEINRPHLCVVPLQDEAKTAAIQLSEMLRTYLPELQVHTVLGGGSVKSLFKRADKSGAEFALIIGEEELQQNAVTMKALREDLEQARWKIDEELFEFLAQQFDYKQE